MSLVVNTPCNPIQIIRINLYDYKNEIYTLEPYTSLCYSTLKVKGERVLIPNAAPLNETVITSKGKEVKIYLFYRSDASPSITVIRAPFTFYLHSSVFRCTAMLGYKTIPAGATNVYIILIGAGGAGGEGGTGGDGFGGNGGGGGGGASGSPGKAGKVDYFRYREVRSTITFSYLTGIICGDKSTTVEILEGGEGKEPNFKRVSGGEDGKDGSNGVAATNGNGAPGGTLAFANSGGRGGNGTPFFNGSGSNGVGQGGGDGGAIINIFGGGGGGGGGGGTQGGILNFLIGPIAYDLEQLPLSRGGNGAPNALTGRDGLKGGIATYPGGVTPDGYGGNGGGGGGGGGGAGVEKAGGGGGVGAPGKLGGSGVVILYYEF